MQWQAPGDSTLHICSLLRRSGYHSNRHGMTPGVPVTTFTHAVQRLHAAVNQPNTEFIRDAVIQRFECCYELAWQMRTLQLGRDGIVAQTPRHTI